MEKINVIELDKVQINENIYKINILKNKSKESLKAWSYLYELLININIDLINENIICNDYGKPYLESKKVYFNISHSKDLVAIILNDKECAIDIQYVDVNKDYSKLMNHLFNDKEQEEYNKTNNKREYFYKLWTKKEVYFKYVGTGIMINQLDIDICNQAIITREILHKNGKYFLSYK